MRRLTVVLMSICILFSGCSINQGNSSAAAYLAQTSENDILELFTRATYITGGFSDSKEISTDELYRFAVLLSGDKDDQWYDDKTQEFLIPLSDIEEILDTYFEEYIFIPGQCQYVEYDEEKNVLRSRAIGFGTGNSNLSLVSTRVIDNDMVEVELLDAADTLEEPFPILIKAKIVDEKIKFISCKK